MRHILAFLLSISLLLPLECYGGYFQSSTTWVARCEKPIEDASEQTADTISVSDSLSPCYAYLMAIADALIATSFEASKSVTQDGITYWNAEVCIPQSADQEGLRQAFLEYAAEHPYPQLTGTSPAYVVASAFAKKWPCDDQ